MGLRCIRTYVGDIGQYRCFLPMYWWEAENDKSESDLVLYDKIRSLKVFFVFCF